MFKVSRYLRILRPGSSSGRGGEKSERGDETKTLFAKSNG